MKHGLAGLCVAIGLAAGLTAGPVPGAARADVFDASPDLRFCMAAMLGGFGNGLEERACAKLFDLPSAYHFSCARGVVRGFRSDMDRAACASFFAEQASAAKAAYVRPESR